MKKYRKAIRAMLLFLLVTVVSVCFSTGAGAANWQKKVSKMLKKSSYDYIIIVGDSRTKYAKNLIGSDADVKKKVLFYGKPGSEHDYLTKTEACDECGYSENDNNRMLKKIIKKVKSIRKKKPKAKIAMIFNFGVNEIYYANLRYSDSAARLNRALKCLKDCMLSDEILQFKTKYGCDMYYDSVNPILETPDRSVKQVLNVNKYIKTKICGEEYTYLDTYNKMKNSCSFLMNDAVHYDETTYYKILYYELKLMQS